MILCVAGNPAVDKLFEVDRLVVGGIHRPEGFVQLPGGKGIHIAQVTRALGAEPLLVTVLGGHAGRWVAEQLEAEGVRGRFAWAGSETRACLSVADRETKRLTEFYESGELLDAEVWRVLEGVVIEELPRASWLAIAGSLPPGAPEDGYARVLRAAHEAGVATALDSRGAALAGALGEQPRLVKINGVEAEELLGVPIENLDQAQVAAGEVRRRAGGSGHAAIVTMSEAGVVMADPDGAIYRGSLTARGAYPVGSGDAFLAGLLVALERGDDWPGAAAVGLGAAAANAETPGAGRLDAGRAGELAESARIDLVG